METSHNQTDMQKQIQNWERKQKMGKILGGFFVLLAGVLLLLREMGYDIPHWIFSWKVLLIVFGLIGAAKNGFSRPFWVLPLTIGLAFLVADFIPYSFNTALIWPLALILLGLFIIFKPRRKGPRGPDSWKKKCKDQMKAMDAGEIINPESPKEKIEYNAILGGIQKSIIAKDFKGGEINAILGGVQLNLSEADFKGQISLEINAFLGGVKLIIPPHWEVKSEINCLLGGVDDGRSLVSVPEGETRTVILEGNVFMGGIEIKNF